MKKMFFILLLIVVLGLLPNTAALAQDENPLEGAAPGEIRPDSFYTAEVLNIANEKTENFGGQMNYSRIIEAKILGTDKDGEIVQIEDQGLASQTESYRLKPGDKIVVGLLNNANPPFYYMADKYRLPAVFWMLGIFFAIGIFFGRLKGFTSIIGLVVSIGILAGFTVPKILEGGNPLTIVLGSAFVIETIAIYLAHGFKKRTSVALASTYLTLLLSTGLAWASVHFGQLFGLGSEEGFYLQIFPGVDINLQGLLLGGIIIGTLGVLDDVTTTQTAVISELKKTDPTLGWPDLYRRGISVGREHIASLINTLALAYAGSSLPLFLLFTLNKTNPLWVILNSELVIEELIRTLVGSASLIMAVPISTFLAARLLEKQTQE